MYIFAIFYNFWNEQQSLGRWGIIVNWLKPKTKRLYPNISKFKDVRTNG